MPRASELEGALFPFQRRAVQRMVDEGRTLVACEMGLGKTLLTIAAIERLFSSGSAKQALIISPASLKYQWDRQIKRWVDRPVVPLVVDGDKDERIADYELVKAGHAEYTIINYEQVINDWDYVYFLPRDIIVIEEATAIKSFDAKRSKAIKLLDAPFKWALTGQPVENRADDVYSIMQWVDPKVLGKPKSFDSHFIERDDRGKVTGYKHLPTLHKLLKPVMIRHTREEVADQMPAVMEEVEYVKLDQNSAKIYNTIASDLLTDLAALRPSSGFDPETYYSGTRRHDDKTGMGKAMAKIMALRMLCDDWHLLHKSGTDYVSGNGAGSAYASQLLKGGLLGSINRAPKLEAIRDTIKGLLEASRENKIVVFSYFKEMLRLIESLTAEITESVLFTGDVLPKDRERAREQFERDPDCRLFLSSDAGGYGLDLPMANYLLNVDLPWSAGKWDQRQSRIIRLSSQFPKVTLVTFMAAGSTDEYQYELLIEKKRVSKAVIDGQIDKSGRLDFTVESLSTFLKTHFV